MEDNKKINDDNQLKDDKQEKDDKQYNNDKQVNDTTHVIDGNQLRNNIHVNGETNLSNDENDNNILYKNTENTIVANSDEKAVNNEEAIQLDTEEKKTVADDKHITVKRTNGQTYKKLKRMMKTTKAMSICNSRADMFKYLAKQFTKLKDYKNSPELAEKCTKLAKKTKKLIKNQIYESALSLKNTASQSQDYKLAAKEFRKLPGYLDADELAVKCDEMAARIEKKTTYRRVSVLALIIILFVSLMVFMNTAFAKYNTANLLMYTGAYSSAVKIYDKLGDYKEAPEKRNEGQYKKGLELMENRSYKEALTAFEAAGEYKDSQVKKTDIEKLIIKGSAVKDTVRLGKHDWVILDITDNKALLVLKKALIGTPYNYSLTDITWEASTLRQWLNSEFYTETFSVEERNNIILSQTNNAANPLTGIENGNDTQDYIFIMSIEEAEKYIALIPKTNRNTWLRTPGSSKSTAAFIASDKSIMENGYEVNSDKFAVRPVLWLSFE